MKNIVLRIMFDGSDYHGWQIQKGDVTVAGTLEAALSQVCRHPVKLHGCGRTDAGVHAEIYCANFMTSSNIPPDRLPLAVNSLLPADISVQSAVDAPADFDANLSCIKKEYTYRIYNSKIRNPFYSKRVYFYPQTLDIDKMKDAARYFVGTHDFAAVRSVGTETKTTIRTVFWYDIENCGDLIEFRACADGFLYNMARAMAGTLLYVSEGKILPQELPTLLEQKDRRKTGPTVPPDGLYLTRIWYDGKIGENFKK
ncbi:MAG: tRNA pseudouridine(38-40) synthase TruA [Oscillospiraceae bacterium]|nr:tRNA pseudouridine(38-40) synthase TruA [Oscillospiraceae bacterium]